MSDHFHDPEQHSFLKVLDNCEWMSGSKDSTRQQTFDDVMKYKATLRKKNQDLKQQLEKTKQLILNKALGLYLQELSQLNKENQKLRSQYRKIHEAKKPLNVCTSTYANQVLHTPRSRKSVVNVCYGNSKLSSSKVSQQQQFSGRKSLKNKQNFKSTALYGRNSLKSPRVTHHNNVLQNTERKNYANVKFSSVSQLYEDKCSMRSSFRPSLQRIVTQNQNQQKIQKNTFLNMVNLILQEQKLKQLEYKQFLEEEKKHFSEFDREYKKERFYVNQLQFQVKESQKNIVKLEEIVKKYEIDISDMGVQINEVSKMTKQLFELKGQFMKMQRKCDRVKDIKREVSLKENRLQILKQQIGSNHKKFKIRPPQSVKMVLRVFGLQEEKVHDAHKCKTQLKKLVKGKLDKPTKKKVKHKRRQKKVQGTNDHLQYENFQNIDEDQQLQNEGKQKTKKRN